MPKSGHTPVTVIHWMDGWYTFSESRVMWMCNLFIMYHCIHSLCISSWVLCGRSEMCDTSMSMCHCADVLCVIVTCCVWRVAEMGVMSWVIQKNRFWCSFYQSWLLCHKLQVWTVQTVLKCAQTLYLTFLEPVHASFISKKCLTWSLKVILITEYSVSLCVFKCC
jgi:hypothetical protein